MIILEDVLTGFLNAFHAVALSNTGKSIANLFIHFAFCSRYNRFKFQVTPTNSSQSDSLELFPLKLTKYTYIQK